MDSIFDNKFYLKTDNENVIVFDSNTNLPVFSFRENNFSKYFNKEKNVYIIGCFQFSEDDFQSINSLIEKNILELKNNIDNIKNSKIKRLKEIKEEENNYKKKKELQLENNK